MKAKKNPYSYVVLRYMHDVFTREFVNVGVLLHAPHARCLAFEKLSSLDRVKGMFPGLQSDSLRDLLNFLASRADSIQAKTDELFDRDVLSADSVAKALLPIDDSALQWSAAGGGVTDEPQQALKELFERLVTRHLKAHPPTRRDDADVWKPFERELRQRDILYRLQEKVLTVGELRHRFDNAWQPPGGYLRLFQPLSFDLLQPSDIVEKAIRWSALIRQLRKADQDFLIYLLLGRPSAKGHSLKAFDQAYETLNEETGGRKELVPEENARTFAAEVERKSKLLPTTEMGDGLPQGWVEITLQNAGVWRTGGTPSRRRPDFFGKGIPWVKSGDLPDGPILKTEEQITQLGIENSSAKLMPVGTISMALYGATIGKLGMMTFPAATNQACANVIPDTRLVEPKFLLNYLRSERRNFIEQGKGGAQPNISQEIVRTHPFRLAPLAEQRRIVAKLETLLGKVDASQQRLAKIPVLLKRFRQSVLAAACSGRLTADWREENSNVQPASEVIAAAKPADDLPSGWAWCSLGDYVNNLDGKRVPISSKLRESRKGAFPYYGASGVIDSIDGFTHDGEFVLIGEDGANLLSRSTSIAFLAKGQIWVNNHAHVLRCKHSFPNAYLAAYINSIDLAPYVSGTAQPKLNQANMNTIPVPVPPLPEQQEIVRRVEGLFALADQLEQRLAKARGQVDALTPSLLARAFSGKLVSQDPNDEPAEKLLKGLKAKP